MRQLVNGVLTQDSDTFLYGATVVYKDLSINERVCTFAKYCNTAIFAVTEF